MTIALRLLAGLLVIWLLVGATFLGALIIAMLRDRDDWQAELDDDLVDLELRRLIDEELER